MRRGQRRVDLTLPGGPEKHLVSRCGVSRAGGTELLTPMDFSADVKGFLQWKGIVQHMILVRAYHKYFYVLRQICNVSWFIKFNSSSICMIEQLAILGTFFFKYTQTVEIIKLSYLWFLLCQFSVPSSCCSFAITWSSWWILFLYMSDCV